MSFAKSKNQQPNHNNTLPGRGHALHEAEAANVLGISVRTLPAWRARKQGPRWVKLGRSVRYFEADLFEFIERNLVDPARGEV